MSRRVLLATNNAKKLAELRRILAQQHLDIEVLGLADIEPYPEPAETEWTFEGNALLKARAGVQHSGLVTLADDSGLSVDALNGMPGTRSARWAGPRQDDEANLQLVLDQIDDVAPGRRGAQFRCVMALVTPAGQEFTTHGVMSGQLTTEPRGEQGFGYDPIFTPDGHQRTCAQLSSQEKDAISHRGQAVREVVPVLAGVLGLTVEQKEGQG